MKKSSAPSKPKAIAAGLKGQQPTDVWQDYSWIIVSNEDYEVSQR